MASTLNDLKCLKIHETESMFIRIVTRCLILLGVLWFCLAAAEFPVFKMPEFEKAKTNDAFFFEIPDVDVPRVSERQYGADKLPRLPVQSVIIEGVVSHPTLGISQSAVQTLVDSTFQRLQDIELDDNGFTQRDLNDIGGLLRGIIDRGGYDQDDLSHLVQLVRSQEVTRGWITIEQLDDIAITVTEYYRSRGFILATAFVPEQEVSDGVIRLRVLEGRLADVTVSNNNVFAANTIRAPLLPEIGGPVTEKSIENALRRINDLPGVRVKGSFSPGGNIGETNLNLGVIEEKSWRTSLLIDNHGSETTGETRLFVTSEWLNVLNRGHKILVGVLRSEGPDNALYGLAEYEMPFTKNRRGTATFGLSTNTFSVGATSAIPEIEGETNNYSVSGAYQFLRNRESNLNLSSKIVYKDVGLQVGPVSTNQKIAVFSAGLDFSQLWDERQLLLSGQVGLDFGKILEGEVRRQGLEFNKTRVNLNLLKRFSIMNRFSDRRNHFNLVIKATAQYSDKFLPSVEQFSLGGPRGVRAFGPSDISVDSGVVSSMELLFDLPFDPMRLLNLPLDPIKPYVFLDYGYGVARRPGGGDDQDGQIKGWGLGFRLNWHGRGAANLVFARPHSTQFDRDFPGTQGKYRVYFDFLYQVH